MVSLGIVTPLYNAARFIAETVGSVVAQMAPGDVYVVVDDGSTDDSAARLAPFLERITLIRQANGGEAAAVNRGVAALQASVVGVVNADDPILPGLLDAMRRAFASDPALAAAYCDWRRIGPDGEFIADMIARDFDFAVLLGEHLCIPGPGAFFRPNLMGNEPVRRACAGAISDYDFWLRFARENRAIVRIPEVLATWRAHRSGATFQEANRTLAETKIAIIEEFLARPDLPKDARALAQQARSAAYYNAALLGLRGADVPAWRYALASYAIQLRWPSHIGRLQRRSLTRLCYAACQPLSGALHSALDSALPQRFSRAAVRDQTFGVDIAPRR